MKGKGLVLTVAALVWVANGMSAYGQRGMGDAAGMAQRPVKPELTSLSGNVVSVATAPCEKTTGRSLAGTHMFLDTGDDEPLNIHLGPAAAVREIVEQLSAGSQVTVTAFRTDQMPERHYVAKSLSLDGETLELRDDNLRPFWAGGGRRQRARQEGSGRRGPGGRGARGR